MSDRSLVQLIQIITSLIGDLEQAFLQQVEEAGLTSRQMDYLGVIGRLGHPSLGELAQELGLSKPSVTAIVDKLSAMGFIERVRSDADRRSAHVHLSKKGVELEKLHDEVHRKIAELFQKSLNKEDLASLVELLSKAINNV